MLFSIIVPIYNVEKYLKKCIESVLAQNYNDYELLLIDDCSTDNSVNIAKEYEVLSNVRIIRKKKNMGLSDTRNVGLKEAKGEYILFLDSDDYIEIDCLEKIKKILTDNNNPEVVYFGFFEEYGVKVKKGYGFKSVRNNLYTGYEFAISELSKRTLYAPACFGIYRRSFLIYNNLFFKVGIFHEDELWTPQVVLKASSIFTSDYTYYHYVRREESITTKKDKTQNGIDLINICKELDNLLPVIIDKKLRKLMDNHIAMLYMKGMSEGKLFTKERVKYIDRFYPLGKTCFAKDYAKAFLFALSLRLYHEMNSLKDMMQ